MADPTSPQSEPTTPRWVGTQEAATAAKVSTTTIRRWIASGDLRAIRVGPRGGTRIRVDLDSVLALVVPA